MDSQLSDSVVHVDDRRTWTVALFASFRPSDHHVSDDEIFELLEAGSDREAAADLCAARGIAFPMYCAWKARYRHMNLEELREARRRELWRARCLVGVLLATTVVGAGGLVFGLARAAQASITSVSSPAPSPAAVLAPVVADPNVRVTDSPANQLASPERSQGGDNRPVATPAPAFQIATPRVSASSLEPTPVERPSRSDAPPTTSEPGYKIQVAAAPTLQEGHELLARLTSSGYPAYLSRAFVNNTEVFRVRVGPFDTLPAAEEIASQLKRDGFTGAWIAR